MDRKFFDGHDSARIKVLGPWRPTRWLWADHHRQAVAVESVAKHRDALGALVCYSGSRLGYNCGRILNLHVDIGQWRNVWYSNFRAIEGDNGGPVFLPGNKARPTKVKAYGIVAGKHGESHSFGNHIDEIQNRLGVQVIT